MNLSFLIDRLADIYPDRDAFLLDDGATRDWRTVRARVDRIAGGLAERGIGQGDRVAILALNGPHYLEIACAVARRGAILLPLNMRLGAAELRYQLADAEPVLMFASAAFAELADATAPALDRVWVDAAPTGETLEDMIDTARPVADFVPVAGNDVLGIFYTSGTTGTPKGAMLTHQGVFANAALLIPTVGYAADGISLHVAPMFHVADFCASFAQLMAGGRHAFVPRFDPAAVLAAVETHRVTDMILIPAMIHALIHHPEIGEHDLSSWRLLFYGGAPIAPDMLRRCFDVLPCGLAQGYGQTEATHTISILTKDDHRRALDEPGLLGRCGQPLPGVHARIVDVDGAPVPAGEIGEIIVRASHVMKGYWNRPEETAEVLRGGWLHTGDLGTLDADGYLALIDRKKDMIVSGGENVYSAEVENALASHPGVAEMAVIGVPDESLGEHVHAVIVPAGDTPPSETDLQDHCRQTIAGYKIPRSFEFADALPRTAASKVQKEILREPHWRGRERRIS